MACVIDRLLRVGRSGASVKRGQESWGLEKAEPAFVKDGGSTLNTIVLLPTSTATLNLDYNEVKMLPANFGVVLQWDILLLINIGTLIVESWVLPSVISIGEIIIFFLYEIYLGDWCLLKTENRHISLSS